MRVKAWLSTTLGAAVGAGVAAGAYDGIVLAWGGRLSGSVAALVALASAGRVASVLAAVAVVAALLLWVGLHPRGPREVAGALLAAPPSLLAGAMVGLLAYGVLVAGGAWGLAVEIRTDVLRQWALGLTAVAAAPAGLLAFALTRRAAARVLPGRWAWALPAAIAGAGLVVLVRARDTLVLMGPDATVAPAALCALGLVGAWAGARAGRRGRRALAVATAVLLVWAWLPFGPDVRAALAFGAPTAGSFQLGWATGSEVRPYPASPPPPRFRLTPGSRLRRRWPVVLVTIDSLRPDHLGCYGYRRPTSPHLDRLAARSVRFRRAYAPGSSTRFSLPPMLTSRYVSQLSMRGRAILPENTTVAELLRDAGYETVGLMATTERGTGPGVGQGFRTFRHSFNLRGGHVDGRITDDAIEQVRRARSTSLFLWVHYYDPHTPWERPAGAPDWGGDDRGRYDAEIWSTDRQVGRLLDAVEERFGADGAVVIVAADHGDAFGEHGKIGHSGQIFEELVRIPLLIRIPGAAPKTSPMLASLLDLTPTVLDVVGVRTRARFEGRSLLGHLEGAAPDRDRMVFEELRWGRADKRGATAVHWGRYHLLVDASTDATQLFDVEADPAEQEPLAITGRRRWVERTLHDAVRGLRARIDESSDRERP